MENQITSNSEDQNILSRFEEVLRRPDYILEPGCWATIVEYIKAGGKPEQLVESLSDSYVGYAQMATLVCGWMKLVTEDKGPPDSSAAGPSVVASKQETLLDEFYFLREFAKQKFDSKKLDKVVKDSGKPPAWVEQLTQDPRGRQMIYDLSATHNCLLMNYGIQKILLQGLEAEVASVGSSLASYFSVFHRLLIARLRAASALCCSEGQASELSNLAKELCDSCSQNLHTYLHAQELLLWFSRHPHGQVFLWLSQELEMATAAAQPVAWNLRAAMLPSGSSLELVRATTAVSSILSSSAPQSSPELKLLVDLYTSHPSLSLAPIQSVPQLTKILISCMFIPGKPLAADSQAAIVELLAKSTCCIDGDRDKEGEARRLQATREGLVEALKLGQRAQGKLTPEDAKPVAKVAEIPIACIGLIHLMKHHLSSKDYYNEAAALKATPVFARLSVFIAKRQPRLLYLVSDLFEVTLRALGNSLAELPKIFLDASVILLRDCGWSKEITEMIDRWSKDADPSLVRHLIGNMLAELKAPYSPTFASWLLKHMTSSRIRQAREGQRGDGRTKLLLIEFARTCGLPHASAPLQAREASLLQELQKEAREQR